MCEAIQKHLNVNRIDWKLIHSNAFLDLRTVLDNVMKERTAMNIGVNTKQAQLITYDMEEILWQKGILGESTPDQLRDTVQFLLGFNFFLRAVCEHYYLRRWSPEQNSQITFERNGKGQRCMVYREDACTKTHDGGLKDMRNDRKEVWVVPLENPDRCPVRLTDKYIGLCPPYYGKSNFYLHGLTRTTPAQWYGEQVVGEGTLGKTVGKIMKAGGFTGYYTGHSCRRTGGTRLFQAGVQRKLVKECTGHKSDAVDKYQITSDAQREEISKIVAKQPTCTITSAGTSASVMGNATETKLVSQSSVNSVKKLDSNNDIPEPKVVVPKSDSCSCGNSASQVGGMIENLIKTIQKREGKSTIKFCIEITTE